MSSVNVKKLIQMTCLPPAIGQNDQGFQRGILVFDPNSTSYWWQDQVTRTLVCLATKEEVNDIVTRAKSGDWSQVPSFKFHKERGLIEKRTASKWYQVNHSANGCCAMPDQQGSKQNVVASTSSGKPCRTWPPHDQEPPAKQPRIGLTDRLKFEKQAISSHSTSLSNDDKNDICLANDQQIEKLKNELEFALKTTLSMPNSQLSEMAPRLPEIQAQLLVGRALHEDTVSAELRSAAKPSETKAVQTDLKSNYFSSNKTLSDQFKLDIAEKTEGSLRRKIKELQNKNVSDQLKLERARKAEKNLQKKIKELEKKNVSDQLKLENARKAEKKSQKKIKDFEKQLSLEEAVNVDMVSELRTELDLSQKELDRMKAESLELAKRQACKPSHSKGIQTDLESTFPSKKDYRSVQLKLEIAEKTEQILRKKLTAVTAQYCEENKELKKQTEKDKEALCTHYSSRIRKLQENVKSMEENEGNYKQKMAKLTQENNIMKSTLPDLYSSY